MISLRRRRRWKERKVWMNGKEKRRMMDEIDGLSSCQQKRRPFSLYVLLFPPSFFSPNSKSSIRHSPRIFAGCRQLECLPRHSLTVHLRHRREYKKTTTLASFIAQHSIDARVDSAMRSCNQRQRVFLFWHNMKRESSCHQPQQQQQSNQQVQMLRGEE